MFLKQWSWVNNNQVQLLADWIQYGWVACHVHYHHSEITILKMLGIEFDLRDSENEINNMYSTMF